MTLRLFRGECAPSAVADELGAHHYLGPSFRGWAWSDERGVMVFAAPTSRSLPRDWLELARWCIRVGLRNAGSSQWAEVRRHILSEHPAVTTVVSYSDPGAGHGGALYRSCGWVWAPTWHRLRPPPTGGGTWDGETYETPKDRWIAVLRPDDRRASVLAIRDASLERRWPWLAWSEPRFVRGVARQFEGGYDRARWIDVKRAIEWAQEAGDE